MIEPFEFRRILVALDATPIGDAALAAAMGLASRLGAEIEAIFVEDETWARLSEYGFAVHVTSATGRARPMDVEMVRASVRMQTTRIRRTLTTLTTRAGVECGFRVVKGSVSSALLEAAGGADLLVLGTSSGAVPPALVRQVLRVGSTAWAMAERAPRSVLLLHGTPVFAGPVTVLFDGSAGADRALAAALRVAQAGEVPLRVLAPRDGESAARRLEAAVDAAVAHSGIVPVVKPLPQASVRRICELTEDAQGGLLVVAADCDLLAGEERRSLLQNARCAILLVR